MAKNLRERRYIDLAGHHDETRKGVPQIVEMEVCYPCNGGLVTETQVSERQFNIYFCSVP